MLRYFFLLVVFIFSFAAISPRDFVAEEHFIRTEKRHFKLVNKMRTGGKKGRRFVLVQTAEGATFEENPEKPDSFRLVLHEINPYIQFYKAQPSKSYGIIFMRQYVWFCQIGKSAFLKCKRGAIGYVSGYDPENEGGSRPEVFELLRPTYLRKENKLIYEISDVDTFKVKKKDLKNVTLVIDLALN